MPGSPIVRAWLLTRVDQRCTDTIVALLREMTEDLSLATSEAVTLRRLSADGRWLHPVAAYHPDRRIRTAIMDNMARTAQTTASGLWQPVIGERRVVRWEVPPGSVPPEAAPAQADFLRRYPVRAIIAAPLATPRDEVVGGVALHRYVADRPFTDEDEVLLLDFAERAALAVEFHQVVPTLGGPRPPA
jgi:GAF domain-containing protein